MFARYHNYDKYPEIRIKGFDSEAFEGYPAIVAEIKRRIEGKTKAVVVLDFYPGVDEKEVLEGFLYLNPVKMFSADDCTYDNATYEAMIKDYLTDDRVFGVLTTKKLSDFF